MKLGLEIHQRLNTHKLFCECPSPETSSKSSSLVTQKIVRILHPVYSELGEMDKAAMEAAEQEQMFEYLFYNDYNCLVELDEEPPHSMNEDALRIGLEIASHLKSKPVNEVHVMRKIVIDGSNTSGFQRTAVIALGGKIESEKGNVRISTIAIEEESAGIVTRIDEANERKVVYSLDRLGIPLVEIGTEPDIKDFEHLKEIAEKLGLILRATGKVMRGLGTIRQDVNISIEGGARVEIKGAQDLKLLPLLAENEVKRQQSLLAIISELKKRFEGEILLKGNLVDLSNVFARTQAKIINAGLEKGQRIIGAKLERYVELLGKEINPNRRYGTELSEYAKTAGVKGIIHSDENLNKYGITNNEIEEAKKLLNVKNEDAFILIVAEQKTAKKAFEKIFERVRMEYIPKETRKANEDGTSSYMRQLSGKARLYPETDIPPIKITPELVKSIIEHSSEGLEEKRERLLKLLNNKEMTERILRSKYFKLFEKLIEEGIEPMFAATTLEETLTMLRRENVVVNEESIINLFFAYKKGEFVKAAVPDILREISKGKTIEQALDERQLRKITKLELEKIVKENNGNLTNIMAKYRLQVDAKEAMEIINMDKNN